MAPLRIGLTGNIGAGKSTVCREFERLGVPVYYADARAKVLMQEDPELTAAVRKAFGDKAYTDQGLLDRVYMAEQVFRKDKARERLNALVHPAVARDAERWHATQTAPYTLYEAAILFEIGARDRYDSIIVVDCPYPIRERRVMARDGISADQFRARARVQWDDEKKRSLADIVVVNDGRELILPQVLATHRRLLAQTPSG